MPPGVQERSSSKRSSSFELTSVFRRPTSRDCPGPPAPTGPVGVELRFSPPTIGAEGGLPAADGSHSLYCAVIVKKVDAGTRAKTSINELLRGI